MEYKNGMCTGMRDGKLFLYKAAKNEIVNGYYKVPDFIDGLFGNPFENEKVEVLDLNNVQIITSSITKINGLRTIILSDKTKEIDFIFFGNNCPETLKEIIFPKQYRPIKFVNFDRLDQPSRKFWESLTEESKLNLIKYNPFILEKIPSDLYTNLFLDKAKKAIVTGIKEQEAYEGYTTEGMERDLAYLEMLGNFIEAHRELRPKQSDQILKAIEKFNEK